MGLDHGSLGSMVGQVPDDAMHTGMVHFRGISIPKW